METPKEEGEQKKGKVIITSIPLGDNNWAYQMFMEAEKQGFKGPLPMVWDEAHRISSEWFEGLSKEILRSMEGMASFKCDIDLDKILKASGGLVKEHYWLSQEDSKKVLEVKYVGKHRVTSEFIFMAVNNAIILDGTYNLNAYGISYTLVKENQEFYYLHNGQYVGNAMLWWRKGGSGYTTNIDEAAKFTREQALNYHRSRSTDIPWNSDHVDARAIRTADHQYMDAINILKP